jgi:UDP-glucose:glycoprotein glucosyltransferase
MSRETVYDEQPSAYFPFLSLLSTHLPSFAGLSDQAVLTRSLDLLESHRILSTPSALSTLQYALGLHTTSPRIEAQYSWYNSTVDEAALGVETCETWVQWKGKGFCDVETLRAGIERGIEDGTVHAYVSSLRLQHA